MKKPNKTIVFTGIGIGGAIILLSLLGLVFMSFLTMEEAVEQLSVLKSPDHSTELTLRNINDGFESRSWIYEVHQGESAEKRAIASCDMGGILSYRLIRWVDVTSFIVRAEYRHSSITTYFRRSQRLPKDYVVSLSKPVIPCDTYYSEDKQNRKLLSKEFHLIEFGLGEEFLSYKGVAEEREDPFIPYRPKE